MKSFKNLKVPAVVLAMTVPLMLTACAREVSSESQHTTNPDGSTKSKEVTVKEGYDGSMTTEETKKSTPPTKP